MEAFSQPSAPRPEVEQWMEALAEGWQEPGDLDQSLRRIVETAAEAFATDLSVIFAVNPITGRFYEKPAFAGELRPTARREALSPPREHGFTRQVLETGLELVEDLSHLPEAEVNFCREQGIRCFAAVALYTTRHRKPLAVLYLDFRVERPLGPDQVEAFEHFARLASRQLEQTWFLRRYQWVARMGQRLTRRITTERQLFNEMCNWVGRILDAQHCFLLAIHRPQGDTVDLYARIDGHKVTLHGRSLTGGLKWVMRSDDSLLIHSLHDESAGFVGRVEQSLPEEMGWKPESLLFVPLRGEDRSLGVLSVQHPAPQMYDDEDRYLLELLANQVALALENLRLLDHLQRLHATGQALTRHLESEEVLQVVVDAIRETVGCDLVILYPYVQATETFEFPVKLSGDLRDKDFPEPRAVRPDDMAHLVVRRKEPVFANDSHHLYARLGGDAARRKGNFEEREGILSTVAVPLLVGAEAVGALFLNFRSRQRFTGPQKQLIGGLASYAAIAIKNARTFGDETRRRLRELEGLQRIDRELNRSADLQSLLEKILQLAVESVQPDQAAILLYNSRRGELIPQVAHGSHREDSLKAVVREAEGRGLVLRVLKTKEPVLAGDVRDPQWRDLFIEVTEETRSELDVPLLDENDEVVGIFNLESRRPHAFKERDRELLKTLAGQAVLAVQKEQAYAHERRLVKEGMTLIKVGKELTRRLELQGLLELILDRALDIAEAPAGVLVLARGSGGDLVVAAEKGNPEGELGRALSRDAGIIGLMAREWGRRPFINADLTLPEWKKLHIPAIPGMHSELAVPLVAGDELRGVLNIESPEVRHFKEHDERLLLALADLAVIALQNAERFESAEQRQRKLEALDDLGRKVVEQLDDADGVMRAVVQHALRLTGADIADLDVFEGERWTTVYQSVAEEGGAAKRLDLGAPGVEPPPRGIMRQVAETREPLLVPGDAAKHPAYAATHTDIHSELVVPLRRRGGDLYGVLNVESRRFDAFDHDDLKILDLFAKQAVIAIENSRNYARAERQIKRFQLLYDAGRELSQITDQPQLDEAYDIVLRMARKQCGGQVVVRRFDPETKDLVLTRSTFREGPPLFERIPWDDPLNGRAARRKKTQVVPDAENPPPDIGPFECSDSRDRAFVVTPIFLRDNYYGNLALSHEEPHHYREADVQLLEGLARQLALTLHRLEEIAALREAQQRNMELDSMSWIGEQTYQINHQLGNDLGLVPRSVRKVRRKLREMGNPMDGGVEKELDVIAADVQQVLDRSRNLEAELTKQAHSEMACIELRPLIEDAVKALRLGENESRVRLNLDLDRDLGATRADYKQLTAALLNLLTNAVEAMPNGGTLTVGAARAGQAVKLWVRDTGRGIAPDEQKKVFNLFYSTKKRSAGFGLWSVRRTILRHGGQIDLESELGVGTTFTIVLPWEECDHG